MPFYFTIQLSIPGLKRQISVSSFFWSKTARLNYCSLSLSDCFLCIDDSLISVFKLLFSFSSLSTWQFKITRNFHECQTSNRSAWAFFIARHGRKLCSRYFHNKQPTLEFGYHILNTYFSCGLKLFLSKRISSYSE